MLVGIVVKNNDNEYLLLKKKIEETFLKNRILKLEKQVNMIESINNEKIKNYAK